MNVRIKTIKLFKENTGVHLHDLEFDSGFLLHNQQNKSKLLNFKTKQKKTFELQRTLPR